MACLGFQDVFLMLLVEHYRIAPGGFAILIETLDADVFLAPPYPIFRSGQWAIPYRGEALTSGYIGYEVYHFNFRS